MTTTLRTWFDGFTQQTGEVPTHIVLGATGWYFADHDVWDGVQRDKLIAFAEVPDEVLDKKFDDGYGGNNSPDLCAWSKSWTIFAVNYDGAEWLGWVPRHPKAHTPSRFGGG